MTSRTIAVITSLYLGLVYSSTSLLADSDLTQIVDFEDVSVRPSTGTPSNSISSRGFNFRATTRLRRNNRFATPDNGSTHLSMSDFYGANRVTMSIVTGEPFGISAIDLTGATTRCNCDDRNGVLQAATNIEVTGVYAHGGTIQQNFDVAPADETWRTYQFTDEWVGLSRVVLRGFGTPGDNGYALDNIQIVPEPNGFVIAVMLITCWKCMRNSRAAVSPSA